MKEWGFEGVIEREGEDRGRKRREREKKAEKWSKGGKKERERGYFYLPSSVILLDDNN